MSVASKQIGAQKRADTACIRKRRSCLPEIERVMPKKNDRLPTHLLGIKNAWRLPLAYVNIGSIPRIANHFNSLPTKSPASLGSANGSLGPINPVETHVLRRFRRFGPFSWQLPRGRLLVPPTCGRCPRTFRAIDFESSARVGKWRTLPRFSPER